MSLYHHLQQPLALAVPSLSVQLLTVSVIVLKRTIRHNQISSKKLIRDNYDFIVVGSGTAGAIVAGRLTENPNVRALVLEAGKPQTVLTDSPSHARQQINSEIDWSYRTTPQIPNAGLAYDGRVAIPRGRIVGGSHNMNYMVYSRGNRRDYDTWANEYGATGWSYNEVLPYFLRSENNTDRKILEANPGYHSTSGPVVVETPPNPDPIITLMMNTLINQYGYRIGDQNGASQFGINYFQQTIFPNKTRSTTASVFLEANVDRPNLQVLTSAFVTRILFSGTSNLTAIGVEFEYQNKIRRVYATREVILSAGSINTPQLLMLSGIGPKDHLSEFGIQTLVDLPVGYNLQDHAFVTLDYEVFDPSLITSGIEWNLRNMYKYFAESAGPLAQLPLVYFYFNSPYNKETDWPDLQIDFNVTPLVDNLEQMVSIYSERVRDQWRNYYQNFIGQKTRLGILCFHHRPRSIGRLYLNSSDPHASPLIDTRYLTVPYDIMSLKQSIRTAMQLANSPPFPRYIRPYPHPIPGCQLCPGSRPIWECDSYLECYARTVTSTVGHQVGTCRMGSRQDSVVDPRLRVRGVNSLRVIDGSVLPKITNGNTNAPVMMIAEYGSEMIRKNYNL